MEYRFHIENSFSPATMPMERLAEYIKALAQLFGETNSVHLERVTEGSVVLHAAVDQPAKIKVRDRVATIGTRAVGKEVSRAFGVLDDMLRKDNATGRLVGAEGSVVIPFPGRNRVEPAVFGPFRQLGSIEGQVIRVGGKDETIPVHLRDGAIVHTGLNASEEVARRIAQHLLGATVRVHGMGTWLREGNGTWHLKTFRINDFDVLDDAPIERVVTNLRSVEGSGWGNVPDPVRELLEERRGGRDRQ